MSGRSWRIVGLVTLIGILCLLLASRQHLRSDTTSVSSKWFPSTNPASVHVVQADSRCKAWPDPGNLAIAVKTGATEAMRRIPSQMLTFLKCAATVMIFSDLQQDILGYHVHDALASIDEAVMADNSDFDFYKKLKEAERLGQIEEMLGDYHDPRTPADLASWTLDKYKQLHILEELYEAYPDKAWYVMIDADTYLVWPNLLEWLQQLPDPKTTAQYLGAPAQVGETQFGHGGSGIVLSHAAISKFTAQKFARQWDRPMHDECCGDYIIAKALIELDIRLKPSWPTINGETPFTIPYGESHWCQPVVSMHHVTPAEMNDINIFEQTRNGTKPLTFSELFDHFVRDNLPKSLDDWDNKSNDERINADSFAACERACVSKKECFQFVHSGNECHLGYSIRIGGVKPSQYDQSMRSGWLKDRIFEWTGNQAACHPKFPWT